MIIVQPLMKRILGLVFWTWFCLTHYAAGATFSVDASRSVGTVSSKLYGLMTEEINHSYDGGLYAELLRNRAFLDSTNGPEHWSAINGGAGSGIMSLDFGTPYNEELTASLKVMVTNASKNSPAGVANSGYWG